MDRDSVDNTIAELVETEELKKATEEEITNPTATLLAPIDQLQVPTDPPLVMQPPDVSVNTKKGSLITKTYVLKKPKVKQSFKCSECNTVKQMYEHEEKSYKCNSCDYSSHFASELEVHKTVHRTNPPHQCMHANCSGESGT